ncbi:MAG TPA: hydrogenase expression/formation protein HypE [bacterium]|nr:hydrogenase expression/formation protein HypE [bacterium]
MTLKNIMLSHGAGGKQTHDLIAELFVENFSNIYLDSLDDSAVLGQEGPDSEFVFTTDSYVVKPTFFPGGNIGKLAVCGTVNDLAVMGAVPKYLSCGFIIEDGFLFSDLEKIVVSMKSALDEAGSRIVTGDTKVVEKGAADGIFINTAGVGVRKKGIRPGISSIQEGDVILINGFIGDHGLAVMAERENFPFKTSVTTDCAPLNGLISKLVEAVPGTRFMRDATRGGLATVLNEIASESSLGIRLDEQSIPKRETTAKFCDMLGLDPLYLANEGKVVAVVPGTDLETALAALKSHPYGTDSAVIGRLVGEHPGRVTIKTAIGGSRILDMLTGDPLPRIC